MATVFGFHFLNLETGIKYQCHVACKEKLDAGKDSSPRTFTIREPRRSQFRREREYKDAVAAALACSVCGRPMTKW